MVAAGHRARAEVVLAIILVQLITAGTRNLLRRMINSPFNSNEAKVSATLLGCPLSSTFH